MIFDDRYSKMSGPSRGAAASLSRSAVSRYTARRSFATQHIPGLPPVAPSKTATKNNNPLPVPPTIFPAPSDPFDVDVMTNKRPVPPKHSAFRIKVAELGAKVLGYNSRASTSIRETGRMMRGICMSVERDDEYWYGGECLSSRLSVELMDTTELSLPRTYQTFFQIHLFYLLILLPRLRALQPNLVPPHHSIGRRPLPSEAAVTSEVKEQGTTGTSILSKPNDKAYPTELLNHFFELAESQMRRVLGRSERERAVTKYMAEMGQQWKGCGMAVDYAIGLSMSQDPIERETADVELAAYLWRNVFDARGLGPPPLPPADGEGPMSGRVKELELPRHLVEMVAYFRSEMARLDRISDEDVLNGNIGLWTPLGQQSRGTPGVTEAEVLI